MLFNALSFNGILFDQSETVLESSDEQELERIMSPLNAKQKAVIILREIEELTGTVGGEVSPIIDKKTGLPMNVSGGHGPAYIKTIQELKRQQTNVEQIYFSIRTICCYQAFIMS